jgi:hypothetical protein
VTEEQVKPFEQHLAQTPVNEEVLKRAYRPAFHTVLVKSLTEPD